MRAGMHTARRRSGRGTHGFTLLEVVFASALLGFALLALFALHNVAIRNNRHAARITTCAMLAQQQMEYLLGLPWPADQAAPTDLNVVGPDTNPIPNGFLYYPNGGVKPSPINAKGTTDPKDGARRYYRTWTVSYPFSSDTRVIRIQVRVIFYDEANGKPHGVTISSFRYVDSNGYTGT